MIIIIIIIMIILEMINDIYLLLLARAPKIRILVLKQDH